MRYLFTALLFCMSCNTFGDVEYAPENNQSPNSTTNNSVNAVPNLNNSTTNNTSTNNLSFTNNSNNNIAPTVVIDTVNPPCTTTSKVAFYGSGSDLHIHSFTTDALRIGFNLELELVSRTLTVHGEITNDDSIPTAGRWMTRVSGDQISAAYLECPEEIAMNSVLRWTSLFQGYNSSADEFESLTPTECLERPRVDLTYYRQGSPASSHPIWIESGQLFNQFQRAVMLPHEPRAVVGTAGPHALILTDEISYFVQTTTREVIPIFLRATHAVSLDSNDYFTAFRHSPNRVTLDRWNIQGSNLERKHTVELVGDFGELLNFETSQNYLILTFRSEPWTFETFVFEVGVCEEISCSPPRLMLVAELAALDMKVAKNVQTIALTRPELNLFQLIEYLDETFEVSNATYSNFVAECAK